MSEGALIITIGLGIAAVTHCLYQAVYLLTLNDKQANRIMAFLLLTLSVRIGKSMIALAVPEFTEQLSALGLIVMTFIGPLDMYYVRSLVEGRLTFQWFDILHALPAILVTGSVLVALNSQTLFVGYVAVNIQMAIYLVACVVYLKLNPQFKTDDVAWRWIVYLLVGLSAIWLGFMVQLVFGRQQFYLWAALINVVVLYALSLLARQHDKVLAEVPKKKKLSLLHHDLASKIEKLLSEEAFKDSLLTLSKTAVMLKVPAYVVSHTVNSHFNKSFPELLLSTRLKRAQSLLADPAHKYLTIEAIAYESGFSSLSAFYSGFKKAHKITPAQFRAQHEIEGSIAAVL